MPNDAARGAKRTGGRTWQAWVLAVVLAVTAAAYLPAAGGEFHWDDGLAVLANPVVVEPGRLGPSDFVPPSLGRKRPLTDVTFAVNRATTGWANPPFVYTNVAIHLLAVLLGFAVARALLERTGHPRAGGLALAIATLFALHPLQTEAVSYVCQRAESLASALFLLAMLLLLRAEQHFPNRPWGRWMVLGALAFAGAVAAKSIAVTLPFVALAVMLLAGRREGWSTRRAVAVLAIPAAMALVFVAATFTGLEGGKDAGFGGGGLLGPWRYLLTEAWVISRYVRLLLWPSGLSLDHAVRMSGGLGDPVTLALGATLLAFVFGTALLALRTVRAGGPPEARAVALGGLWYLLLLAPTSSFVPLADPMAEHRTYLANFGLLLALAVVAEWGLRRIVSPAHAAKFGVAMAFMAAVALAATLVARNRVWGSDRALWADAVAKSPGLFRPRQQLGNALWRAGALEEALAQYRAAEERTAPLTEGWVMARKAVAHGLTSMGRHDEAREQLEMAIGRAPDVAGLWEALANARFAASDFPGAAGAVARARARGLGGAELATVAGKAAASMGDLPTALEELRSAVTGAPLSATKRSDLAIVAKLAGLDAEACDSLERFLALEPNGPMRSEGARLGRAWGCEVP